MMMMMIMMMMITSFLFMQVCRNTLHTLVGTCHGIHLLFSVFTTFLVSFFSFPTDFPFAFFSFEPTN